MAPPPAPNLPASPIKSQTQQSSPTDHRHSTILHPQPCVERAIMLIDDPAPKTAPCDFPPPLSPNQTIPAWVTPPVSVPDSNPDPQRADVPRIVPPQAPPPAPNLTTGQPQQSPMITCRHSTIPKWAQPAVTSPVSTGMSYTGKLPPRPEKKPIPFKKKAQTKPHAANQKDFL